VTQDGTAQGGAQTAARRGWKRVEHFTAQEQEGSVRLFHWVTGLEWTFPQLRDSVGATWDGLQDFDFSQDGWQARLARRLGRSPLPDRVSRQLDQHVAFQDDAVRSSDPGSQPAGRGGVADAEVSSARRGDSILSAADPAEHPPSHHAPHEFIALFVVGFVVTGALLVCFWVEGGSPYGCRGRSY
jgi:hypothetical protein